MSIELSDRPVVVTGGGNGIGAGLAREAAARGASVVVVVDVNESAAQSVAADISASGTAEAHACDVSDAVAVEALAEHVAQTHGQPAVVCANAGVMSPTAPLLDTPATDAEWILSVNTRGVLHTLQSFGRRLAAGKQPGWLMATGSEHSLGVPHLYAGLYTASKHAVLGICDVLRGELPEHVGLSVLCPGLTTSQLWNAGQVRPDEFGGPIEGDPQSGAFMEHAGMSAAVVAQRAFDGIAEGHFLIPTHYNARAYAERRAADAGEAFDRLAEIDTTDYDVNTLAAELIAQMAQGAEDG